MFRLPLPRICQITNVRTVQWLYAPHKYPSLCDFDKDFTFELRSSDFALRTARSSSFGSRTSKQREGSEAGGVTIHAERHSTVRARIRDSCSAWSNLTGDCIQKSTLHIREINRTSRHSSTIDGNGGQRRPVGRSDHLYTRHPAGHTQS